MNRWLYRLGLVLALAFLALTVLNASWIAPRPSGTPKLIAQRGIQQLATTSDAGCSAHAVEPIYHDYIENSVISIRRSLAHGAKMAAIDIVPTSDGKIAVFRDRSLECRTNGTGPVREKALAELQRLDIGYGYSADSGATHPLRGSDAGKGQMPELKQVIANIPNAKQLMYRFTADNPREAELLSAALEQAGRDPVAEGDAFYGAAGPVAEMRRRYPGVWAFTPEEARQCASDYMLTGWSGILPSSCKGGTMVIPLNRQFLYWGWPNRLIARMEAAGGHVIVGGPSDSARPDAGLTLPEQLTDIPSTFNGYIWVEDGWNIPPALFPSVDRRTTAQREAAAEAISRRRAAQ